MTTPEPEETFWQKVRQDAAHYAPMFNLDSKFLRYVQLIFFAPGFQLALSRRFQEVVKKIPFIGKLLRRIIWYMTSIYFGSEISVEAKIGSGIYFPHPYGIVIGGSIIGKNVTINQNVTLGRKIPGPDGNFYPIIEDGASIYTGAVVLGNITIGKNAIIGANAVVTKDIPANTIAYGIPARWKEATN